MLIFESDLLNALDFLFIISGAPVESIEGLLLKNQQIERAHSLKILKKKINHQDGFFFPDQDSRFLEVLYLKLAFLDQVARRVLPDLERHRHPELGLSLDRIWIHLSDSSEMIPPFWRFRVKLIQDDLEKDSFKPSAFPKSSPAYGHYFMGLVWLCTLLVNRRQGSMAVHSAAEKITERMTSEDGSDGSRLRNGFDVDLSPENIFWEPDGKQVPEEWFDLWEKALEMGLALFRCGLNPGEVLSQEEFLRQLDHLRRQNRKALFEGPSSTMRQPRRFQDDREIQNILIRIRDRLSIGVDETVSRREPFPKEVFSDETEMAETVILPRRPSKIHKESVQDGKSQPQEGTPGDDLVETVVLGQDGKGLGDSAVLSSSPPPKKAPNEDEADGEGDLLETVAISPDKKVEPAHFRKPVSESDKEAGPTEELEETVVVHRGDRSGNQTDPSPNEPLSSDRGPDSSKQEEMPETVILPRPGQGKSGFDSEKTRPYTRPPERSETRESGEDGEDDDIMSETIIIRPGGLNNEE